MRSRSRSCFRARSCHATSQNPQDSRIDRGIIQDGKLRGFAMGQAIPVRTDYTAGEVRWVAQRAKDAAQARRLLAIAAVLDGASREEAGPSPPPAASARGLKKVGLRIRPLVGCCAGHSW